MVDQETKDASGASAEAVVADAAGASTESFSAGERQFLEHLAKQRGEELPASKKEEPAGEGEAAEESAEPEPEKKAEPAKAANKDRERAVATLRRDGFTTEEIDAMDESKLLERAAKRQKAHAEIDKAFDLSSKARKQGESGKEEPAGRTPDAGDPQVSRDLDEVLKPVFEQYGEDAGKAIRSALDSVVQPLQQQLQMVTAHLNEQIEQSYRSKISGDHPELATDEGYAAVRETAMELLGTSKFKGDFAGALKAAAMLEYGAPAAKPPAVDPEKRELASKKRAGSMMTNGKAPELRAKSDDEKAYEAFALYRTGVDPLEARRRVFGG